MSSLAALDLYASLLPETPHDSTPPVFAGVEEGLALIEQGGPEQLPSDSIRADLKWFAILQRALEAMSARWLAELDRREQQAPDDPQVRQPSPPRWPCFHPQITAPRDLPTGAQTRLMQRHWAEG